MKKMKFSCRWLSLFCSLLLTCSMLFSCSLIDGFFNGTESLETDSLPVTTDVPTLNSSEQTHQPGGVETSDQTQSSNGTESEPPTEELDTETIVPSFDLFINDIPISDYRIVYAASPLTKKIGSRTGRSIGEDIGQYLLGTDNKCDFDYQSACRLQKLIYRKTGVKLEVVSDAQTSETAYEILVGNTNRLNVSISSPEVFTRRIKMFSNQYVFCGGSYGATWHSIDQIEIFFETDEKKLDLTDVSIASGCCDLTVIACIGDSITYGTQALPMGTNASANGVTAAFGNVAADSYIKNWLSYPAVLGRENWKDCVVYNYGRSWACLLNYNVNGPYYYANTPQFKECLAASDSDDICFDMVLFMLGTNDAAQNNTWTQEKKTEFKNEIKSIMDQILVGSENAQLVMMNVPHRGGQGTLNTLGGYVRDVQEEAARGLLSEGYRVTLFNMNAYTIRNLSHDPSKESNDLRVEYEIHKDYYNIVTETDAVDATHPTYLGYSVMARGVGELVNYLTGRGEMPVAYIIDLS